VDVSWPWHIENFWLHIYFEQGWFGLLSVALLIVYTLIAAVRRLWRGDLFAGTVVASIAGFLVVGALNSPNDNPQLMFLFLLLSWVACRRVQTVQAGEGGAPVRSSTPTPSVRKEFPVATPVNSRFEELDTLRAVAAIAVVLVHYRIHFGVQQLPAVFDVWVQGGLLAVDFFFVLSGFVLCRRYWSEARRSRLLANLWERIARLYPLHVLTLLLVAWGQWYLTTELNEKPFKYQLNDGYHFVLNLLLLNAVGMEKGFSYNAPSWSVSTEFVINALFLLLIVFPRRLATPLILVLAAGSFALLLNTGTVVVDNRALLAPGSIIGMIDGALIRTCFGFFVGVLLWRATASWIDRYGSEGSRWADVVFLIAGVCIAALFGSYRIRQAIPYSEFVLVLVLFPILVASATVSQRVRAVLKWAPLVLLGHASYSIYLLHFPLQLGLHIFATSTGTRLPYDETWFLLAFLLLTFICAVGVYRWIELPAKRGLRALAK